MFVYFDGITAAGCSVKNALVSVPEDWAMHQIVSAIREAEFQAFKLNTMKVYVKIG